MPMPTLKSLFSRAAQAAPGAVADAIGELDDHLETGVKTVNASGNPLHGDPALNDLLHRRGVGHHGDGGIGMMGGVLSGNIVENEVRAWRFVNEFVSRSLIAAHPLLSWAVQLNLDMILGGGLDPIVALDAERLGITPEEAETIGAQMEAVFRQWADSKLATTNELTNFHGTVEAALRRAFSTGELALKLDWVMATASRFCTRAVAVETTRIARVGIIKAENGNRLLDGIEIDPLSRVAAAWVLPYLPTGVYSQGPTMYSATPVRVPTKLASNRPNFVFEVMDRQGPEVHRGISPVASAVLSACAADELLGTNIRSAAARASVVFALEQSGGDTTPEEGRAAVMGGDPGVGGQHEKPHPQAGVLQAMEFLDKVPLTWKPQTLSVLPANTTLKLVGSDPDGKQYEALNDAILANVARGMGVTRAMLNSDLSDESFSASRLNNLAPWILAARRRERCVAPLYSAAAYCVWEEAVQSGMIQLPAQKSIYDDVEGWLSAVSWAGPVPPELDESKSATADIELLAAGVTSLQQVSKRRGVDWRATVRQIANERKYAEQFGVELTYVQPQLRKANEPSETTPAKKGPANATA